MHNIRNTHNTHNTYNLLQQWKNKNEKACFTHAILPWEGKCVIISLFLFCFILFRYYLLSTFLFHFFLLLPNVMIFFFCFFNTHLGYGTFVHRNVWHAHSGEPCVHSELLDAFVHFTLNQFGFLNSRPPSGPAVTIIARRDYMGRRLDRKLGSEEQIARSLQAKAGGRGTRPFFLFLFFFSIFLSFPLFFFFIFLFLFSSFAFFLLFPVFFRYLFISFPFFSHIATFNVVDFAKMSFKEQVETVHKKTNILIGMHGAG